MNDVAGCIRSLWARISETDRLGPRIRLLSAQTEEAESRAANLMSEFAALDDEVAEWTAALWAHYEEADGVPGPTAL